MPAVRIKNREQYIRAIEVLDRVGGTWQGVGQDEWFLLVTTAQYRALMDAQVIVPEDPKKESSGGKNSRTRVKS